MDGLLGSMWVVLGHSAKHQFINLDEEMVKKLITSIIRPRLEYAEVVWSPKLKKDVRKLERI